MAKKNSDIKIGKIENVKPAEIETKVEKKAKKNWLDFSHLDKSFLSMVFGVCGLIYIVGGVINMRAGEMDSAGYFFFGIVLEVVALMYLGGNLGKKK